MRNSGSESPVLGGVSSFLSWLDGTGFGAVVWGLGPVSATSGVRMWPRQAPSKPEDNQDTSEQCHKNRSCTTSQLMSQAVKEEDE